MKKFQLLPLFIACLICTIAWFSKPTKDWPTFESEDFGYNIHYILDAGHGGEDGGAVSGTGIPESHINLDITKKLDVLLGFLGSPTIMTRTEDLSIHNSDAKTLKEKKVSDLKNRVAIMNQYPQATLISIHQNTYPEKKYRGTQVFFAPTADSKELACLLQQTIISTLQPENNRQEKQIPDTVYLMNHIKNRAVLIECGFLTNPEEEQLLRSSEYQKKLALTLSSGLTSQNQVK